MKSTYAEGIFDQAKGKVKQTLGETFNNQKLANEGAADQVKGHVEEAWGKVKDAASDISKRKTSEARAHEASTGHDLREKVTHAAENAKASISRGIDHLKHDK